MGTTEKNLGQQQLFAYLKICTTRPDPGNCTSMLSDRLLLFVNNFDCVLIDDDNYTIHMISFTLLSTADPHADDQNNDILRRNAETRKVCCSNRITDFGQSSQVVKRPCNRRITRRKCMPKIGEAGEKRGSQQHLVNASYGVPGSTLCLQCFTQNCTSHGLANHVPTQLMFSPYSNNYVTNLEALITHLKPAAALTLQQEIFALIAFPALEGKPPTTAIQLSILYKDVHGTLAPQGHHISTWTKSKTEYEIQCVFIRTNTYSGGLIKPAAQAPCDGSSAQLPHDISGDGKRKVKEEKRRLIVILPEESHLDLKPITNTYPVIYKLSTDVMHVEATTYLNASECLQVHTVVLWM
ncbi:hypothetical protein Anapl_02258 [Anas platyrhynchos]|uniref:Uncharacterized protein n=1 Tax=Anas platyrhynchos TaxID=8839 RepID=R0KFF2_ANAPL|nr:hypothetical protein Anapl_02258 [Anas platyrhynchos]